MSTKCLVPAHSSNEKQIRNYNTHMNTDRRLSLRTCVDLPFAWLPLAEPQSAVQLCESFELPAFVQLQGHLVELDTELDHMLHNVSDSAVIGALRLLDAKLDLLCEAQQVGVNVPAWKSIELSADGIGFETKEKLRSGVWIGIHLVLPTVYHLLGSARVNHIEVRDGGCWIGAELHDLEPATAKKLTRFVIGSKRE